MTQDRSELFAALAELCAKYPHWRFGQLVANVSDWADVEVWDVEDDQLLTAALSHLGTQTAHHHERQPETADEMDAETAESLR